MADPREALERARLAQMRIRPGRQGPASDLPTQDPDELYSRYVPGSRDDIWRQPFNREFDFTGGQGTPVPVGYDANALETIGSRAKAFINQYFDGVDSPVVNPATGRFYGNEIKAHDAMHQFANVGNTLRSEELLSVAEKVGASPLAGSGLFGLTQQQGEFGATRRAPADFADVGEAEADDKVRTRGRTLVQQRGAARGSSLFRDGNSVTSFLSPPITYEEVGEMKKRGQEFYDQVHDSWISYRNNHPAFADQAIMGQPEASDYGAFDAQDAARQQFIDENLSRVLIRGGYKDPGGLPYGVKEQFMNAPLTPTVDANRYEESIRRQLREVEGTLADKVNAEKDKFLSPEQAALRQAPETWDAMADRLRESESEMDFGSNYEDPAVAKKVQQYRAIYRDAMQDGISNRTTADMLKEVLGPRPQSPRDIDVYPYSSLIGSNTIGYPSLKDAKGFDEARAGVGEALDNVMKDLRGQNFGGIIGAGPTRGGRVYLNPANLGATAMRITQDDKRLVPNADDILLTAAAEAKQAESYQRQLPLIKGAIKGGSRVAAEVTGSLPLFDQDFRQAVEQGNAGKAAGIVARDTTIGAAAAPLVGGAAGVVQRLAPAAAARVLPALAAVSRAGNPVAAVSQLGGDRRQSAKQRALEFKQNPVATGGMGPSASPQLLRAEQARRRGGRWKIGPFTLPELGLSEAGGLFFR